MDFPKEEQKAGTEVVRDVSKVTNTSNNLFHLRSQGRLLSSEGAHVQPAEESDIHIEPLHDSFITAEHDEKERQQNQSVSAVFKKSASQLPQIARIKKEILHS